MSQAALTGTGTWSKWHILCVNTKAVVRSHNTILEVLLRWTPQSQCLLGPEAVTVRLSGFGLVTSTVPVRTHKAGYYTNPELQINCFHVSDTETHPNSIDSLKYVLTQEGVDFSLCGTPSVTTVLECVTFWALLIKCKMFSFY